ncbi:MAG: TolC family protein [Deltaproteobacteria bacterium]|nr:TolC family protein [Deltaproteobacteria bacterium]
MVLFLPLSLPAEEKTEKLVLGLEECLQRALQSNEELKANDYDKEIAEQKLRELHKIGYPIVDYEYTLAPAPRDADNAVKSFFSGDITVFNKVKIGVGTPLTTFGKLDIGQGLARKGVEAEKLKRVQKKSELVLKVKQLYYGIILSYEFDRLLESATQRVRKEINKREGEEEGTDPSELLKLKLFRHELEKRAEESEKKRMLAREALKIQMGLDRSVSLELKESHLKALPKSLKNFDYYQDQAAKNRPELKLIDLGVQSKEDLYRLEKRKLAPNLGLGAFFEMGRAPGVTGVQATDDFNNPFNFTRAGIGLQLQGQFDFHGQSAKAHQARSDLRKTEVQRTLAQKGIALDVQEAYLDAQTAWSAVERAEEAGRLSRQLLFLTQSSFDIGVGESKDLVEAVQSFLTTRGQYFEAVYNFNVALAKLDQKRGKDPDEE